jgi:hypothetical protein
MMHNWTPRPITQTSTNKRAAERRTVALPARLTWKDQRGAARFASVVARNISEFGVYVECHSAVSIPLYRLVQFQLEHQGTLDSNLPAALRTGRILSAVYRVSPAAPSGTRQGLALRLMIDPKRHSTEMSQTRASA